MDQFNETIQRNNSTKGITLSHSEDLDDMIAMDIDELEFWLNDELGSVFGFDEWRIAALRAEILGRRVLGPR